MNVAVRNFALIFLVCLFATSATQAASVYLAVEAGTTVIDENGQPLRDSLTGEVMKWVADHGDRVELSSPVKNLPGGFVDRTKTSPATAEHYLAWRTNPEALKAHAILSTERGRRLAVPKETIAEWYESEKTTAQVPVVWKLADTESTGPVKEPAVGWLNVGINSIIHSICPMPDGKIVLMGSSDHLKVAGDLITWNQAMTDKPGIFFMLLSPPFKTVDKVIWASAGDLGAPVSLRSESDGTLTFVTSTIAPSLRPSPVSEASAFFVRLDRSMEKIADIYPLDAVNRLPISAQTDPLNRPVFLYGSPERHGEGCLLRLFSNGQAERPWKDWPDGNQEVIKLDFSSPSLAKGPFALWSKQGDTYPDFSTPMGDWGAAPNAGQPVVWTNANGGVNPISKADLKPEAMVLDSSGNVIVSGTIPFLMPLPDFDPFLMSFSPEGKLRWTNCYLTGLLSEPDQKTQALTIDPSNGDILVCYWQHGNNRQTLLLDPNGWLNKFTGTNGNIKITWIGRVDADSGRLKNSTYIHSRMPNAKNPRWPDLNSVTTKAMSVDSAGRVYVGGGTTIAFPTTTNAFLPYVSEYGGHPFFSVIKPDLSGPVYSTYLSPGQGDVDHLGVLPGGAAILVGSHSTEGTALPVVNTEGHSFLSSTPPAGQKQGVFLAILPVPDEDVSWEFAD